MVTVDQLVRILAQTSREDWVFLTWDLTVDYTTKDYATLEKESAVKPQPRDPRMRSRRPCAAAPERYVW